MSEQSSWGPWAGNPPPAPWGADPVRDMWSYWTDAWQRAALFYCIMHLPDRVMSAYARAAS